MQRKWMAGAWLAMAGFIAGLAVAQAVPPSGREDLIENADVRVWRRVIAPGFAVAQHRHDHPRVVIPLSSGQMTFTDGDGTVTTQQWQAGKAYWLPAQPPGATHAEANKGSTALDLVAVELLTAH